MEKERRAKEAQVLPTDEDPQLDFDTVGSTLQGMLSLRVFWFPKSTPLYESVYSMQRHLKRFKFLKTEVADSSLVDSEKFFMSCPELSDEECSLIRFNLMNDECMKLSEEKRCLLENMTVCSASMHDFACVPDSFNSNAFPSDLAMSLSSCAGSPEDAPANRDTAKDNDNIVSSLELHGCEHVELHNFVHSAFLRAIH